MPHSVDTPIGFTVSRGSKYCLYTVIGAPDALTFLLLFGRAVSCCYSCFTIGFLFGPTIGSLSADYGLLAYYCLTIGVV